MRYLVTGVNGQLGYDIVKKLQERGHTDILAATHSVMDITNEENVLKVVSEYKPDVIFHCAAWTKVDKAEDEKDACFDVNVNGTKYIANAANKVGAKMIYLSTDYVFDGTKEGLYEVDDKTNPQNVYGVTKYLGEEEVRKALLNYYIVRISWVFGVNGNNFIKTMLKLGETKESLNVVCDQIGSPTSTDDLSKLLIQMSETEKYGTYHATNEGFCSWAEFAKYIMDESNSKTIINPVPSIEYPQKAYRPKNSCMSKTALDEAGFERLPDWHDSVKKYIKEIK